MSHADGLITLHEFPGRDAEIVQLDMPVADARRLRSLGAFEGQTIELLRGGGSAFVMSVAGGQIAVASEIAQQIVVRAAQGSAISAGGNTSTP